MPVKFTLYGDLRFFSTNSQYMSSQIINYLRTSDYILKILSEILTSHVYKMVTEAIF